MVELRPVGLSEDGSRLLLSDATGRKFAVPVDERLRTALGGNRARLGQLEIEMDSALRPRDIQARIRAGDSPEDVAEVAQVPMERVMGYAVPVLAERQHVAERAQRSAVRRKDEGPGRLLGDAVAERLRSRNINPESAEWDAWRREDGRWTVTVSYHSGERERAASFVYDAAGRYVVADDDDARWLVGEPSTTSGPRPRDRSARRLTAVTDDAAVDVSVSGDDALPFEDQIMTADLTAVADALRDGEGDREGDEGDLSVSQEADQSDEADSTTTTESESQGAGVVKSRRRSRRGRASIPSWDEIMFGQPDKE